MSMTATHPITVDHVPTTSVTPSPWLNPRKHFNKKRDDELAASVEQKGILQPLFVRSVDGAYQILAGERRWRAAQKVGLAELPVIIRNVSDKEAIEIAFTENDQREAMHPLDDARGYQTWLRLDPEATIESIAAKLGRPVSHVRRRYRLLELHPEVVAALEEDRISVTHAERICTVPDQDQQVEALQACFEQVFDFETGGMKDALVPVRKLDDFLSTVALDLTAETTQQDFPEMAADVARAIAEGAAVLQLSTDHSHRKPRPGDPLPSNYWEECSHGDAGAQLGVFVVGRRKGERIHVRLKAEESAPARPSSGSGPSREPSIGSDPTTDASSAPPPPPSPAASRREDEKYEAAKIRDQRIQVAAFVDAAKRTKKVTGDRVLELILALSEAGGFSDELAQGLSTALKLPLDVFNFGVDERTLRKISPTQQLQVLTIFTLVANRHRLTIGGYKAFGVNVKRVAAGVDRQLAREKKAAKAAAAKVKKGAKR